MKASFGSSWLDNFESFDRIPFAAASIGQVHNAVLSAQISPTGKSEPVAVKIQFPNVADSIDSDLGYVKMLLTAGSLLPKGLFLDKTIQVMKSELHDECDYEREASFLRKFGSSDFLGTDERYKVPWVWKGSTKTVLVMERVNGRSVGATAVHELTQRDRDEVSAPIFPRDANRPTLESDRLRRESSTFACANFSCSERCRRIRTGRTSCGIPTHAKSNWSISGRVVNIPRSSSIIGLGCSTRLFLETAKRVLIGA